MTARKPATARSTSPSRQGRAVQRRLASGLCRQAYTRMLGISQKRQFPCSLGQSVGTLFLGIRFLASPLPGRKFCRGHAAAGVHAVADCLHWTRIHPRTFFPLAYTMSGICVDGGAAAASVNEEGADLCAVDRQDRFDCDPRQRTRCRYFRTCGETPPLSGLVQYTMTVPCCSATSSFRHPVGPKRWGAFGPRGL